MTSAKLDLASFPVEHGPRRGTTFVMLHGGNMAGWTWDPQVASMPDRHVLTPDLPGYGRNADETWPGIAGAADAVADLIRERAVDGRAHVVGLSLGGFVAVELVRRRPELVATCAISGSALTGYAWWERAVVGAQVPLWNRRWYWNAQSRPFGIPEEDRELFVRTTCAAQPMTNRLMVREVGVRALPGKRFAYAGPMLAVAAEHDSASIRRAFAALRVCLPQLQTWTAPGMHHPWNVEDPELFTRMVTTFADAGRWPEAGSDS